MEGRPLVELKMPPVGAVETKEDIPSVSSSDPIGLKELLEESKDVPGSGPMMKRWIATNDKLKNLQTEVHKNMGEERRAIGKVLAALKGGG